MYSLIRNNNNQKKIFNINLGLLKIYLSFVVVNVHCFKNSFFKNKYFLKLLVNNLPVPIFFIISFYFCYNLFVSRNIEKYKQRFERLLLPYFIWPCIIWALNNIFRLVLKIKLSSSFKDLKIQLLTGHCFMTVLWFQYNLIFCTLLILIIQLLFKKNVNLILINLKIIAFFFQISKINYKFFSKYDFNIQYCFGRFFEIIPYCVSGYILSSSGIINILKQSRVKSLYIIFLIKIFVIKYHIFIGQEGFIYQGLQLYTKSISVFIFFSLLPIEKITNISINKIIMIISYPITGVYFLHISIKNYLYNYILLIKNKTLLGSIIIYLLSYLISFIGILIFKNTKMRHLFQ